MRNRQTKETESRLIGVGGGGRKAMAICLRVLDFKVMNIFLE